MEPTEYATLAQLADRHWWYVGMQHIAASLLRRTPLPALGAVLDAGCGAGQGLQWLAEFGVTTGVDLHPLAVQASRRVSARVAQASVQALPFPAETFDLVTSFEVLYHLAVTDDTAALREYARLLKPGGWLMVRVPAHNWLRGAHDRQVHTRHRYAAGELRQKLETAGFCIQRLSPVGLGLLPAAMLRRWLQPHPAAQTDVVLPPAPINAALTWLLGLEGLWLRYLNLPGGLSLLALARKKA